MDPNQLAKLIVDIAIGEAEDTETERCMNRYVKAVLGGFLAILAAFGWVVAIIFALILIAEPPLWGIHIPKGHRLIVAMVPAFVIFSVGFYLAFRAAYSRNSN